MKSSIFVLAVFSTLSTISGEVDLDTLSMSICRIIEEFYTKFSRNVDIIDFGGRQGDLVGAILRNLNNSMTITSMSVENPDSWNWNIENQSILLFEKFSDLRNFNNKDLIFVNFIKPIRLLVYCRNVTLYEIGRMKTAIVIAQYYYFIIFNPYLRLYTFENRNDLINCHESQQLLLINEFSQDDMRWTRYPVMPKKYTNFYNCKMWIGIFQKSIFFISKERDGQVIVEGLSMDILRELASILNFQLSLNGCTINMDCQQKIMEKDYLYNVLIDISLDRYAIRQANYPNVPWSQVLINVECTPQFYVPPGDLYKSIEKLILPFDYETWIGIFWTFTLVSASMLIYNQLPKTLKKLVYERNLQIYGMCRAFFGEGHVNLPKGHSARIIFIAFALWCFVIRTAYQGKLFDFITTAVRRSEVKSLEEMIDEKYTIYLPYEHLSEDLNKFITETTGLPIQQVPTSEYRSIYLNNMSDPSFTGTVITCDLQQSVLRFILQTPLPMRSVPTPIQNSHFAIGFSYPNLWNERLEEIINGLITGGVINYFLQHYTKSKWNKMAAMNDGDSENIVLNLSHLGFGFQICFIALYGCFLVFLLELVVNCIFKNFQAKRGNKIGPFTVKDDQRHQIFAETITTIIKNLENNEEPEESAVSQNPSDSNEKLFGNRLSFSDLATSSNCSERNFLK